MKILVTGGAGYIGAHICKASCKAAQTLGWLPYYSDIDSIVTHAWKWHN